MTIFDLYEAYVQRCFDADEEPMPFQEWLETQREEGPNV